MPWNLMNGERDSFDSSTQKMIKSIYVPDSVTYINAGAFNYCGRLRSVELHEGVTGLWGYYSVDDCDGLESINIPTTMRYFYSLFEYTKNLKVYR